MPEIFKSLTTISAWTLFIIGWISLIAGYFYVAGIYLDWGFAEIKNGMPPVWMPLVGGFICLALSAVIMKLRHSIG